MKERIEDVDIDQEQNEEVEKPILQEFRREYRLSRITRMHEQINTGETNRVCRADREGVGIGGNYPLIEKGYHVLLKKENEPNTKTTRAYHCWKQSKRYVLI